MSIRTPITDLCDNYPERVQIAEPLFRDYGGRDAFFGPIATVRVLEDNALVRAELEQPGDGRVLVVDGGGSLHTALLGGNLAQLGRSNGWDGILVFGCIRDWAELTACDIGIKALAPHPKKSGKKGAGERGVEVRFAGVTFKPGGWIYADRDGVIVAETELKT